MVTENLEQDPSGMRDIDILFVGTFDYFPNQDGAEWFAQDILPLLSDVRSIYYVGHCSPALQTALSFDGKIHVTGRVDKVTPYYHRAKLAMVPIRAAGGTRIKILEAIVHGVPVVSTTLGAEGLDFSVPDHLLLADNAPDFASACQTCLQDRPAAMLRARAALTAFIDQEPFFQQLDAVLSGL